MEQKRIDIQIKKDEARLMAHDYIREHYGTIPFPGEPIQKENEWRIPIQIRYPRVLTDKKNKPYKTRFMNFEYDRNIVINAKSGEIIDKPTFFEVRAAIQNNLNIIHETVAKALVKIGAREFSQIAYAAHMHTPFTDVLANLLLKDHIEVSEHISVLPEDQQTKYLSNIDLLEKLGLVEKNDSRILPGPLLIEVESMGQRENKKPDDILSDALKVFFERGYNHLDSVHQVLGPHLNLSSYCYEKSLEYGSLVPIYYNDFESVINYRYGFSYEKIFKLPRYLMQLQNIGLIDTEIISGERTWIGNESIYSGILGEEEILQPIADLLSMG